MRTLSVLALLLFVGACGSKSSDPAPQPGSATKGVEPTKPPPTGSAAAVAKPAKRPPPTKAQLAEFKKRMKAGWALQKDSKWAEAVVEFEAALVAVPSEQRGLAELGWSAMQAGDFPKARKADEEAVRVAVDKNVKAASLYNLGLVHEKTGDKAAALKSFHASLHLRPHKTVEQAVTRLGATPETAPVFCAAGAAPCTCVVAHAYDEHQIESAKCDPATKPALPVKTFRLFHISSDAFYGSQWTYAVDEANQLVGVIDGDSERGRLSEKIELAKAKLETIAGHSVLWLETKYTSMAAYPGTDFEDSMETEEWETRAVTLCVVGDGKTPTRCPLRDVPLSQIVDKNRIDGDSSTGKKTETIVDVTLGADGTVTVKLVKGASDPQIAKLVGPHKLW